VKILVNQTIIQHKPLLRRSGYWSTLQPVGLSSRVFAKRMTNPPVCMWSVQPVDDRQVGDDEVCVRRCNPRWNSKIESVVLKSAEPFVKQENKEQGQGQASDSRLMDWI
jgi:hypothetical protein